MTLPTAVTYFALTLSAANWLLFLGLTLVHDVPMIRQLVNHVTGAPPKAKAPGAADHKSLTAFDPSETLKSSGGLAEAFKKAGPAPTAAAMSLACLLVALVASGVDKIPDGAAKPAPAAATSPAASTPPGK
jgi:hypothetical protein